MKQRILIAPNSFKECTASVEAANLFEQYLTAKNYDLIKLPISDGGDGFLNVCTSSFNLKILQYKIPHPVDSSDIICNVGFDEKNKIIYIESAEVVGLKLIAKEKRNPLEINTAPLGFLLKKIEEDYRNNKFEVEKVVIGIGGTATTDLGLGVCSVFGLKLFDDYNIPIPVLPKNFVDAKKLNWHEVQLPFEIETIVDVDNPLTGERGAVKVFAKQKGASEKDLDLLELGFINILKLIRDIDYKFNINDLNGAGGGLASGLKIFFNAKVKKSSEFILKDLKLGSIKDQIDFVITGEGSFDQQSLMNKGTGIIINLFKQTSIPVFLCCGVVDENVKSNLPENVRIIELLKFFNSKDESISNFYLGIKKAVDEIKKLI